MCDPVASPPQICPASATRMPHPCPQCGRSMCPCDAVDPPPPPPTHPNTSSCCHRYRGSIKAGGLLTPAYVTSIDSCQTACAARDDCYGFIFTPAAEPLSVARATHAQCTTYNDSDIGDGHTNLRPPAGTPGVHGDNSSDAESASSCCDRCAKTSGCKCWTWCDDSRFSNKTSAPCFLHPAAHGGTPPTPKKVTPNQAGWVAGVLVKGGPPPPVGPPPPAGPGRCELRSSPDAGGSGVSQTFGNRNQTSGRCSGPDTRFENPLYLVNSTREQHQTGVPVGGIGVGYWDFAPDGQIKRVAINNWSPGDDGVLTDTRSGTFLALWEAAAGSHVASGHAYALQRPSVGGAASAAGVGNLDSRGFSSNFTGLFPTATMRIDADRLRVKVWSPLVPQQIENSSLPLAYIDLTVKNPGSEQRAFSVALSFQDVISRGIFDPTAAQIDKFYVPMRRRSDSCSRSVGDFIGAVKGHDKSELHGRQGVVDMHRVATHASALDVGSLTGL
eukprot:COSAG01_NODE_11264_length_1970_cov_1.943346_1_plen_499_part_10